MTVCFDNGQTSRRALKQVIDATGFEAVRRRPGRAPAASGPAQLEPPDDAPAFLTEALRRARASGRGIVLDFHATWCGPCRQFEALTFAEERVQAALARVEFVRIDLDEQPALAAAFGVVSVPHVIVADSEGRVLARVLEFEGPAAFLERLDALAE